MAITTNSKIKPSEAGYQNISNLEGDTLTGTVAQNKAQFDAYPNLIKDHYNALVDDLISELNDKADASSVPSPSSAVPTMDGTGNAGSSTDYARGDHVHPRDSSKADVSHTHGYIDKDGSMSSSTREEVVGAGDYFLLADVSADGRIIKPKGLQFDGSTTRQYLSKAGTWQNLLSEALTSVVVFTKDDDSVMSGLLHISLTSNDTHIPNVKVYTTKSSGGASQTTIWTPLQIQSMSGWRRGVGFYTMSIYAVGQGSDHYSLENGESVLVLHDCDSATWQGISN